MPIEPDKVIAIATVIYTFLTSALAWITWRSTTIASKALSNSRMPIINIIIHSDGNIHQLNINNPSPFSANNVNIKYSFIGRKKVVTISCNANIDIPFNEIIKNKYKYQKFKISYKNEFGEFFSKKVIVEIPAIIRRQG